MPFRLGAVPREAAAGWRLGRRPFSNPSSRKDGGLAEDKRRLLINISHAPPCEAK